MARPRRSVTLSILVALVAVVAVVAGACTSDDAWQQVPAADQRASFEAVLLAGTAQVSDVDDAALDADQLLRLTEVAPEAEIFADRPTRAAGALRVDELLALWHGGGFGADPPNAAVIVDSRAIAVELTGAVYDPAADSVVFSVSGLAGGDGGSPTPLPVGEHTDVALFIDALPTVVNGQITDAVTQSNVKVLGDAPATAMSNLYQQVGSALEMNASRQRAALQSASASTPAGGGAPGAPPAGSDLTAAEWRVLTAG